MHKTLILTMAVFLISACGEDNKAEKEVKKDKEFSCLDSKKEIDAELKKPESKESEYWQLRQMEYNEKCENIYNLG